MAASVGRTVLGLNRQIKQLLSTSYIKQNNVCNILASNKRQASWGSFFKGSKVESKEKEETTEPPLLEEEEDDWFTWSTDGLKVRQGIATVRGYTPPEDVAERVMSVVSSVVGSDISPETTLTDRLVKFQALSQLEEEFDHVIPNTSLTTLTSVADLISFFSTPLVDHTALETISQKDKLPKNLHIQLEPMRFNPESDTFFDGKTAFQGSPTIVSSLKYSRKYEGNSGESRNSRGRTSFDEQELLQEDRDKYRTIRLPSEGIEIKKKIYKRTKEFKITVI